MTLEQYYYIGELIAAVALIISLVYVGLQLRLSAQATRATAAQSYAGTTNAFLGLLSQSPLLAEISIRGITQGMNELSTSERAQFVSFYDQVFMTMETNFFLWRDGVLDERHIGRTQKWHGQYDTGNNSSGVADRHEEPLHIDFSIIISPDRSDDGNVQ